VFENRVLRIFGLKKKEVTGSCRGQHNEDLHNLYPSRNIIRVMILRRMKWDGWGIYHGWERWEVHTLFWLENLKGRKQFGRHRRRWEDGN
jgi:hypothetical protein